MHRQRDDIAIRHEVQIALLVLVHLIEDAPQLVLQVDAVEVGFVLLPRSLGGAGELVPSGNAERSQHRTDDAAVDGVSIAVVIRQFKQRLDVLLLIPQHGAVVIVDQFSVVGNVFVVVYCDAGRWLSLRTNKVLRGSKLVSRTLFSGGCSLIGRIFPFRPSGRTCSPLLFAVYL